MINTALIEGKVVQEFKAINNTRLFGFVVVENSYEYTNNGQFYSKSNKFKIKVAGSLADSCKRHLKNGMMIRAVGKLAQASDDMRKIDLIAEHIEIRSQK